MDEMMRRAKLGALYGDMGRIFTEALRSGGSYFRVDPDYRLADGLIVTCAAFTPTNELHVYQITNPDSPRSRAVAAKFPSVRMLGFTEMMTIVARAGNNAAAVRSGVSEMIHRMQVVILRAGKWVTGQLVSCLSGNAINLLIAAIVGFLAVHSTEIAALVR